MDTITHGIAGALIGKAVFRGEDMFAAQPMNRGRIITWSLVLGAIFPDSDVIRYFFSSDKLLIVTWHRSLTHSLVLLPLWAMLLAGITRAFVNRRKWEAPSFAALTAIYAAGILSHILLDLVTSFGTMIWTPLAWSRPAWDRSEEHTSELQSRLHLVCRLLLEKKKKSIRITVYVICLLPKNILYALVMLVLNLAF